MIYKPEDIAASLAVRSAGTRWGIGTAAQYVKSMVPCFDKSSGAGLCPVEVFGLATADQWAKELADAAGRFTYCDAGMEIDMKSFADGASITPGAILEYDAVLTTRQKDRDGDILEPAGMDIDTKMPLLWQHIQAQPIGKHVKVLHQDENRVVCKFAVADIPLGRDAAVLLKFGALRKSHGFVPTPGEFSPIEIIKGADGKDRANGWHIKKAKCFEGSAVSIPANAGTGVLAYYEKEFDGICTTFSRGLLSTPLAKQWAKGLYEMRPATVSVGIDVAGLQTKAAADPMATEMKCDGCGALCYVDGTCTGCGKMHPSKSGGKAAGAADTKAAASGTLATKDIADLQTKMLGMDPYLEGSFEWISYKLRQSVRAYLESKGVDGVRHGWVDLGATYADQAIVCVHSYDSEDYPCYRIAWGMTDGKPQWSGEPQAVDVKPQVIEKMLGELHRKAAELVAKKSATITTAPLDAAQPQLDRKSIDELARKLAAAALVEPNEDVALKALGPVADVIDCLKMSIDDREFNRLLFSEN